MTVSLWMTEEPTPDTTSLTGDTSTDVCVVGTGIAGLTCAYLLASEGKQVVVIDRGPICGGETERTTAHLASAQDDMFTLLERMHGEEGARLIYQSHDAAISEIERIVRLEKINCAFRRVDGYFILGKGDTKKTLEDELAAAKRAGAKDVELLERAPLDGFESGSTLRFGDQAQFEPLAYCLALAKSILAKGGRIFTETVVSEVKGGVDACVKTESGAKIRCSSVIVATNSPVNDLVVMHTKQEPYRSYVVAFAMPPNAAPFNLFWDTEDPYHYVRLHDGGEGKLFLIVGGGDHKTGQADDADERFAALEKWARDRFPRAGAVTERWSGQVLEPIDGIAFIGRNPLDEKNVYIVTGDSGQGMTHGTIAGMLLRDLILERPNRWEALYDPSRKTLSAHSALEFMKANANVALQMTDWLKPSEVSDTSEIAIGEGAIMRNGTTLEAVHRDTSGIIHTCSAVCPHLGGIVRWNSAEKSWDCPLHGSRFKPSGEVLSGPTTAGLSIA